MLDLKKIAITGGVASGKTSVCQFFKELGAFTVNADKIVHELLKPNTDLGQQIIRQFHLKIDKDGQFSRSEIAEIAFKDPEQLKKLEKLLHPAVLLKIEELYKTACREGRYSSFVVEIPLLFEIEAEKFYDVTIAVESQKEIAKRRFENAGFQKAEYDLRMNRQLSPEQKSARANFTIQNNGSLDELKEKVIELNRTINKQ